MDRMLHVIGHEISLLNPALLLTLTTVLGTAFVGTRIAAVWNLRQKQKELDLATARDFHSLYGEFFSIWKLWRYTYRDVEPGHSATDVSHRHNLLQRSCDVEGKLESILVRVACERTLLPDDVKTLGQFRQLFQQLREAIYANESLDWGSSDHPDYAAFKTLATRIAVLIIGNGRRPPKDAAGMALLEITSNKWEQYVVGDFRND